MTKDIPYNEHFGDKKEDIGAKTPIKSLIDVALNKKASLTSLFRTHLHQLMTAEIRVNDLDLEELGLDSEK